MLLTPAQIKPKSFESRRIFYLFLPGVDASHVYVRAWALGCFHSLTQTFRRALTASVDSCVEIQIECPFGGVTKSGRVWRKVPEKRCWECDKAVQLSQGWTGEPVWPSGKALGW